MKVIRKSEVDEAGKSFYIVIVNYKDRKKGEEGNYPSHPLLSSLSDSYIVDQVESVVCDVAYEKKDECAARIWELTVTFCNRYHIKMIYMFKGTKYVVDEKSDPNELYFLSGAPKFYNNLFFIGGRDPYTRLPEWTSFDNNEDVIDKLGIMEVDFKMPKLYKSFVVFHWNVYLDNKTIEDAQKELKRAKERLAIRKIEIAKTIYDKRRRALIELDLKEDCNPKYYDNTLLLYSYIDLIGQYAQFTDTRSFQFDQMFNEDTYDVALSETCQTIKWWFSSLNYAKEDKMIVVNGVKKWNLKPSIHDSWKDGLLQNIYEQVLDGTI